MHAKVGWYGGLELQFISIYRKCLLDQLLKKVKTVFLVERS